MFVHVVLTEDLREDWTCPTEPPLKIKSLLLLLWRIVDVKPTWTDCDGAGDYDVPNVLSPRDLVSRPDDMDETVLHTPKSRINFMLS